MTENPTTQPKKPKRIRTKYKAAVRLDTLKELENTTVSSFTQLAEKVILIDDVPFGKAQYTDTSGEDKYYKLTTGRKADFLRLIEHHAIIQFVGIKCHIAKVFKDEEKEDIGNIYLERHKQKIKNS
jgi:hypothetical protein